MSTQINMSDGSPMTARAAMQMDKYTTAIEWATLHGNTQLHAQTTEYTCWQAAIMMVYSAHGDVPETNGEAWTGSDRRTRAV